MTKIQRSVDEPESSCKNCDSWRKGRCKRWSVDTDPDFGCLEFFPDRQRWPDADHG